MKLHLTTAGKKGPRCTGLRKVIPVDVWSNDIVPHYVFDGKSPDLSEYTHTGRPRLEWSDASTRTKRRRSSEIEGALDKFSGESHEFIFNAVSHIFSWTNPKSLIYLF